MPLLNDIIAIHRNYFLYLNHRDCIVNKQIINCKQNDKMQHAPFDGSTIIVRKQNLNSMEYFLRNFEWNLFRFLFLSLFKRI